MAIGKSQDEMLNEERNTVRPVVIGLNAGARPEVASGSSEGHRVVMFQSSGR